MTEAVPFWLVWALEGGPPTVRHDRLSKAKDEAMRLAAAHPGKTFLVLQPVAKAITQAVVMTTFDSDLPF